MSNEIVPSDGNNTRDLQVFGADRALVSEIAARLKLMISNGKKLTNDEALALAQYSVATDLNPFLGECYYLPGMGPGPGIAGWRKKAQERLDEECKLANEPSSRFWVDYEETNGELEKKDGDIAVKVVLHDSLTKTAWEQSKLSHFIKSVSAGLNKDDAWDIAERLAGSEPTWSGIGIVYKAENFGPDKFNRYERACKRGEKTALRKRFQSIRLDEPVGFDSGGAIIDVYPVEDEIQQAIEDNTPQPERTTEQIQAELEFD